MGPTSQPSHHALQLLLSVKNRVWRATFVRWIAPTEALATTRQACANATQDTTGTTAVCSLPSQSSRMFGVLQESGGLSGRETSTWTCESKRLRGLLLLESTRTTWYASHGVNKGANLFILSSPPLVEPHPIWILYQTLNSNVPLWRANVC